MSDFFRNLVDGEETSKKPIIKKPWKIAIIDDEEDVHEITKLVLSGVTFQGASLEFLSAYSAEEGFELLKNNPDCAAVLLDVVMETDDAGLILAQRIRLELCYETIQIILRTGQPGYAPEQEIIVRYEINDYKNKTELTHDKLFTTIATSLRSYKQLSALAETKKGLCNVINASASLMREHSVHEFSCGVLTQINALFNLSAQGIFCVSQQTFEDTNENHNNKDNSYIIVATSGEYNYLYGKNINDINNISCITAKQALKEKQHINNDSITALYLSAPSNWEGVVVLEGVIDLKNSDKELLQHFCLNISLGLENAKLFTHLKRAVYFNPLTGLYNRQGLINYSDNIYNQSKDSITLFIIDVDCFNDLIENIGYIFGNKVLKAITSMLLNIFPNNAIVAHFHSDVFAVLLPDTEWDIKKLAKECSKPFVVEDSSMRLGVTLGEAHYNLNDEPFDIEKLIRNAESALRIGKEKRRGMGQAFQPLFEKEKFNRLDLMSDLRNGLIKKELFLQLQPKVSMITKDVVGYEALVRWQHPYKGLMAPNSFIPIAEQSGLYFEVDLYVFRKTLELIKEYPQIIKPISINISANSLHHNDFVEELKALVKEIPVDIRKLEIEITENALVRSDMAIRHLKELKRMGFILCLDDFGAGYSSLSYLLKLPLDIIKIDRTFINHITTDENALAVLKGMLQICEDLNKKVVVEGVETQEQVELLTKLNVDIAQGFFYFKPMMVEEIIIQAL